MSNDLEQVRIFLDIEGVLANFTQYAALALDNLQIPFDHKTNVIDPNPVYSHTTAEVLYDICHGFDFYRSMPKYSWTDVIFEELFKISNGNVYFISRGNKWDRSGWGGKAQWIWENFGDYGYNHLFMVSDVVESPMRGYRLPNDILIDDMLEPNIRRWCQSGGTGFHWQEIDWRVE